MVEATRPCSSGEGRPEGFSLPFLNSREEFLFSNDATVTFAMMLRQPQGTRGEWWNGS